MSLSLQVSSEVYVPTSYTLPTSTGLIETANTIRGGNLTVTKECRLRAIGWIEPLAAGVTKEVGIWTSSGTLLAKATVGALSTSAYFENYPVLKPGFTYVVGAQTKSGEDVASARAPGIPVSYASFGISKHILSSTLAMPNVSSTGGSNWVGDFIFQFDLKTTETRNLPPEPDVIPGGKQFVVLLPKEWIPWQTKEWDLQYQTSTDSVSFLENSNWLDVGTFDISLDEHDKPKGVYVHPVQQAIEPFPYYRYRYRLRTARQETIWSEPVFAGRPQTGLLEGEVYEDAIAPDSIHGGHIKVGAITALLINVDQLSAITSNIGYLIGGVITGSLIRTAAHPQTRLQLTTTGLFGFKNYSVGGLDPAGEVQNLSLRGTDGLNIIANTNRAFKADERAIAWNQDSTIGAPVGDIWSGRWITIRNGLLRSNHILNLRSIRSGGGEGHAVMGIWNTSTNKWSSYIVTSQDDPRVGNDDRVTVGAGNQTRTILTKDGRSRFVHAPYVNRAGRAQFTSTIIDYGGFWFTFRLARRSQNEYRTGIIYHRCRATPMVTVSSGNRGVAIGTRKFTTTNFEFFVYKMYGGNLQASFNIWITWTAMADFDNLGGA